LYFSRFCLFSSFLIIRWTFRLISDWLSQYWLTDWLPHYSNAFLQIMPPSFFGWDWGLNSEHLQSRRSTSWVILPLYLAMANNPSFTYYWPPSARIVKLAIWTPKRSHKVHHLNEKVKIHNWIRKEKVKSEDAKICSVIKYFDRNHIHTTFVTIYFIIITFYY
jgi:hypothetical protein